MSLRSAVLCCLSLGVLAAATQAEPVPFEEGRLALQFGPLYGLQTPPPEAIGATGSAEVQATAGGVITRIELPSGVFAASAISIPFDDETELHYMPPVGGVQLTFTNEAGVFTRAATATGEPLHGVMPLAGIHRFCVFFVACGATPSANVSVPLSVIGEGGLNHVTAIPSVSIEGGTWSAASVTVDGTGEQTQMIAGTVLPGTTGTLVRLVTPVFLSTNTTGTEPMVRGLGVLTFVLRPVPEPATAVLLAAAAVALATLGWRRARARSIGTTS